MKKQNGSLLHVLNYKRAAAAACAVAVSVAILAGCTGKTEPPLAAAAQENQLKPVKTTPVVKKKIGEPLEQVAEVVPSLQMDVIAKANGDVVQVLKKRGDAVKEGEVIARIDTKDIALQKEKGELGIKSAQAQLDKAKEDYRNGLDEMRSAIEKMEKALADTQKNFNKLRNDYDDGLITKLQLEQAETQLNSQKMDIDIQKKKLKTMEETNSLAALEVQLQSSRLGVQEIERSLDHYVITAPISGVLTELPVVEKMTVAPGTPIGQIQQMNPAKIKADLTEQAAAWLRGKQEATFYIAGDGTKRTGKITYLADIMNTSTKTFELNLEADNADQAIKPGTRVQVLLNGEAETNVLSVPVASIVREGSDNYVFVLQQDTVEKRKVELGRIQELDQEILSGVKEGEQLVISGQHQLKDKEKVQVAKPAETK
ncbi:RND transporter [Paenibacillus sp. J31TS4]|uniref:efflux RND transporter periplasmic adaptor subunit n=1 Tax=Paenibacillus sp. J31TS4 TaxID=2807195 RepID=UPI001B084A43|nr:efflux RND transporter periplasmic adaptor subunit [Paenibacillus sp. J31TS4]GIP40367.1 RND transporter [Paenibacillus sp. J31TS4]